MGKDLDGDGALLADGADILPAQLPGEDRTAQAQLRRRLHPRQGVDGHLGTAVEGQVRGSRPGQGRQPPVLDDDGVHAAPACKEELFPGGVHLPVRDQGVDGEVDLHPPGVAVGDRPGELLEGEILRPPAGVEVPAAQVHGVRAALHGGHHGLPVAGGREKLHMPTPSSAA